MEELETIGKNQLCNRHQTQIVLHVCGGGEEGVVYQILFREMENLHFIQTIPENGKKSRKLLKSLDNAVLTLIS